MNHRKTIVSILMLTSLCMSLMTSSFTPQLPQKHTLEKIQEENISAVSLEVNITSPQEGELINVSDITVKWEGSGNIDHYEVKKDDGYWEEVGTSTSHTITLWDGNHTIYVKAVSGSDTEVTDSVTVTVDLDDPSVTITSPEDYPEEVFNTTNVTVEWEGSDNEGGVGIDHYEVRIDDKKWNEVTKRNYTFFELDNGEHTVEVRGVDKAGNIGSGYYADSVSFTVDTNPPTVSITSPKEGEPIGSSSVTVEWTGRDNLTSVNYFVRVDNGTWKEGGWYNEHTFTGLSDGNHTTEVVAMDEGGNAARDTVTFRVDTTSSISITSPAPSEIVSTDVTVRWNASDVTGIDHFEICLDPGEHPDWKIISKEVQHYTFQNVSAGDHTIIVKVVDVLGNTKTDMVTCTVDKTKPTISIQSPSKNTIHSRKVNITWSAHDNYAIDHYEIKIDGGSWKDPYPKEETSYTFKELRNLSGGKHTVMVKAVDKAGNSNTASISFTVNTTPIGGASWGEEIGIGVGTAVAVVLILLYLKKRR